MRRYTIVVNGTEFSVDVREIAADRFQVLLEGQTHEVVLNDDIDLPQATISPSMAVSPYGQATTGHPYSSSDAPAPMPQAAPTFAPAAASPRPVAVKSGVGRGGNVLTAPMPGTISAVDVVPGATVKRGQQLVTLEAMKMFNAIRSPRDGVVSEVLVSVTQSVAFGDVLLRFQE